MAGKARVQKRLYYKIGEACKELGIQPYVLRYWETEFPALAPNKSRSGQRVYSEKEIEIIRRIKTLLYDEGYTIAGAKKKLETELASGALEISDGDTDKGGEEVPVAVAVPAAKPATRGRGASPPEAPVEPRVEEQPLLTLDTGTTERIQTLRSGIEKALQEARDLLALLDSKSP